MHITVCPMRTMVCLFGANVCHVCVFELQPVAPCAFRCNIIVEKSVCVVQAIVICHAPQPSSKQAAVPFVVDMPNPDTRALVLSRASAMGGAWALGELTRATQNEAPANKKSAAPQPAQRGGAASFPSKCARMTKTAMGRFNERGLYSPRRASRPRKIGGNGHYMPWRCTY